MTRCAGRCAATSVAPASPAMRSNSRTIYGEALPGGAPASGQARNVRTRVAVSYDNAGVGANARYDFKGNLLEAERQLATGYQDIPDWDGHDVVLAELAYVVADELRRAEPAHQR